MILQGPEFLIGTDSAELFSRDEDRCTAHGLEAHYYCGLGGCSLAGGGGRPGVFSGWEDWAKAVVASRGRVERMIELERLRGMDEGDSSGMRSVIVDCK
jgi:hypothetical protein